MAKKIDETPQPAHDEDIEEWLEAPASAKVLAGTPSRVLTFLTAVVRYKRIARALRSRGYNVREHQEGWRLLMKTSGYLEPGEDLGSEAPEIADALAELDAWDEPNFRVIRATLARSFPAQGKALMKGLRASTGAAAVVGIRTLLDRLDKLEKSRDKKDREALELLAERGIGPDVRAHLSELVARVQSVELDDGAEIDLETQRKRHNALVALRKWFVEWAEVARANVGRRIDLIRLGLAARRGPGGLAEDGEEEEGEDLEEDVELAASGQDVEVKKVAPRVARAPAPKKKAKKRTRR